MLLPMYDEVAYKHCYQCWILHFSFFGCGLDGAPALTRHNYNLINVLINELLCTNQ